MAVKIYQETSLNRAVKMWIGPKSGAAVKVEATVDGKTLTTLEVLKLSIGKPPAGSLVIPAARAAGLKAAASKPGGAPQNTRGVRK